MTTEEDVNHRETVLEELTDLFNRRGKLVPQDVVEEASDEQHPLHNEFEWDDTVAAGEYRIVQAAQLIRSVKVKVISPTSNDVIQVRAFINVDSKPHHQGSYVPQDVVHHDPQLRQIVLAQMERDWRTFRKRYENHAEFWKMIEDELPNELLPS